MKKLGACPAFFVCDHRKLAERVFYGFIKRLYSL